MVYTTRRARGFSPTAEGSARQRAQKSVIARTRCCDEGGRMSASEADGLVPRAGIEPACRYQRRGILSALCLPISPPGQRDGPHLASGYNLSLVPSRLDVSSLLQRREGRAPIACCASFAWFSRRRGLSEPTTSDASATRKSSVGVFLRWSTKGADSVCCG